MELLISIALFVVLALIAVALKKGSSSTTGHMPYTKAEALFSPAERSFLGVLDQAIDSDYRILGKVRVADVVNIISMQDRGKWQQAFNRISSKHFDFLLCRADDLSVVCVIELDDRSHKKSTRKNRDTFLNDVCHSISLPLVRVPAQRNYVVAELRAMIEGALGKPVLESGSVPSIRI